MVQQNVIKTFHSVEINITIIISTAVICSLPTDISAIYSTNIAIIDYNVH